MCKVGLEVLTEQIDWVDYHESPLWRIWQTQDGNVWIAKVRVHRGARLIADRILQGEARCVGWADRKRGFWGEVFPVSRQPTTIIEDLDALDRVLDETNGFG